MRLSNQQLRKLKKIYADVHGDILSNEQAQETGLAIVRLVLLKEMYKSQLIKEDILHGKDETVTASRRTK